MSSPMSAAEVLEREFFKARAKILEIGATLDRIDRSDGNIANDERTELIRQGLEILLSNDRNRAEQIQLLFSLPFEQQWRRQFGLE